MGAAVGDVQVNCDVSLMLLCRWRILLCCRTRTSCMCSLWSGTWRSSRLGDEGLVTPLDLAGAVSRHGLTGNVWGTSLLNFP